MIVGPVGLHVALFTTCHRRLGLSSVAGSVLLPKPSTEMYGVLGHLHNPQSTVWMALGCSAAVVRRQILGAVPGMSELVAVGPALHPPSAFPNER